MKMLDQLLRVYQRTVAAVALAIGYWLIALYTPTSDIHLGIEVFRAGIPTMSVGSAAALNWMGGIDAVLRIKAGTGCRTLGKRCLCLRVALHTYGSLALLTLSWRIFGYFTGGFTATRSLLTISMLHLALLVPLYYYVEAGEWPRRWRRDFINNWHALL